MVQRMLRIHPAEGERGTDSEDERGDEGCSER